MKIMMLDISVFVGHLHPVLVHLPIGILLMALLFDLLARIPRFAMLKTAVPVVLLAGFLSCVPACLSGYILSGSGDYAQDVMTAHMTAGFALAAFTLVLWCTTQPVFRRRFQLPGNVFSILLFALTALTSFTGHLGGTLTHGDDYLTFSLLTERSRPRPDSAANAFIFEDVIEPILLRKCGHCHQPAKLKGNLSVASLNALLKGGKSGPAVVPGRLDHSEMYKRITLDPKDKDYMPADGKPSLTSSEVRMIKWWIEKAGATEGKKMSELNDSRSILPLTASLLGLAGGDADAGQDDSLQRPVNPAIPAQLDPSLIEKLRTHGLTVKLLYKKPAMLDITLPANSGKKLSELQDDLSKAGRNIVWLNFSNNSLDDSDLAVIRQMPNLERLRLEGNPLTDAILSNLAALKHLESLNLNNSKFSPAGLTKIRQQLPGTRIYCEKL